MNKRLFRSRKDTFLSGVCGGIADYFNFDVSLVRIGWVIATLATGGLGLIAYIIAAVVVPLEPTGGIEDMYTEPQNTQEPQGSAEPKPSQNSYQNTAGSAPWSDNRGLRKESGSARKYTGLFLIVLGIFFLIRRYIPAIDFGMLWAVCLVVVGIGLMTKRG